MLPTRPETKSDWLRLLGVLALVSTAALFGLRTFSDTPAAPPERSFSVRVEHVRSGSTVQLESDEKLLYAGIRAPSQDEPLFEQATRRNAELVEGRQLRLRFDARRRDKKNRLIGYAFADGQMVNETLVREGLAYVRLTPDAQRYGERLLAAQAEARKHRRGLWSVGDSRSAKEGYVANLKYGNFHRLTCAELPKIAAERQTRVARRRSALDRGWAPCVDCRP